MGLPDRRISSPLIDATSEAASMLIFELVMTAGSEKARLVMKILIVKPMPPKNATPAICRQFKSSEMLASLVFTAKIEKKRIPRNLPASSPVIMPIEFLFVRLATISLGKTIAVLANAKMGIIINATG